MSIRIMKQNLQEALKGLAKVVCGKTTLPILACVRLKSENSTLTISGTDLEQWLDYRIKLPENSEPLDCIVRLEALKEFREPTKWSLYNSFTETAKKYSPARADFCYRRLAGLFDMK